MWRDPLGARSELVGGGSRQAARLGMRVPEPSSTMSNSKIFVFAATRELRACADAVTPVSSGRSLSLPHHALAGGRGMLPWWERLHCGRGQRAFASV
jgi:hypothetical protein